MTENQKAPAKRADDGTIFIGKKPTMSYVLAAITQFGNSDEIRIRARGRSISTAVDVAEVLRGRFMKDVKNTVSIGTDEVTDKDNRKLRVSTINISMKK
ncbi:MAG: DNA-binding protein Alba [Candidatus Aenigmarchaeota archaeon]|nr:DNA-binding protein Alba [Candidatus Aenigmarchaeota archaeon]